jgi:8-oxo-dGTP pyrophosphatase MutT (NUDIX family)
MHIVVGIVTFDEAVLLIDRAKPPFKGFYALPGGKVEDESAADAVFREVVEETGIEAADVVHVGRYDEVVIEDEIYEHDIDVFHITPSSRTVTSSAEGNVAPYTPDEIAEIERLVPSDRRILKRFFDGERGFNAYIELHRRGDDYNVVDESLIE